MWSSRLKDNWIKVSSNVKSWLESESNHIEKDAVIFFVNLSVAPTPMMDKFFLEFGGFAHFLK